MLDDKDLMAAVWAIRHFFHREVCLVHMAMGIAILPAVYLVMLLLLGLSAEDRMVVTRVSGRLGINLSQ